MKRLTEFNNNYKISPLYQDILNADTTGVTVGDPLSTLNRLSEFFKLFLSDGVNSEYAYLFGLKDA